MLLRLIGRWLNDAPRGKHPLAPRRRDAAGWSSPLLANIYLHEVLDDWFAEVQPTLKGMAKLVRFADDFVAVFRGRMKRNDSFSSYRRASARIGVVGVVDRPARRATACA